MISRYDFATSRYDFTASRYDFTTSRYDFTTSRYDFTTSRYDFTTSRYDFTTSRYECITVILLEKQLVDNHYTFQNNLNVNNIQYYPLFPSKRQQIFFIFKIIYLKPKKPHIKDLWFFG